MMRVAALVGLGMAATLGAAVPASAADSANGKLLAERWCASCHVIDHNAPRTMQQGPPSFRAIARGSRTEAQLQTFLVHPHGSMPDLALTRSEIDDLLAYIATLR